MTTLPPELVTGFLFALGSIIGSFLNVVALRFISGEDVVSARSHCPACLKTLAWYELVPIVSFIALRARCRRCNHSISWQYPIVEAMMGISIILIMSPALAAGSSLLAPVLLCVIVSLLLVLAVIDMHTLLLPDVFVGALLMIVVVYCFLLPVHDWTDRLIGAASSTAFLGLLWVVTSGRGIGLGDVKIMVPLGILFGWPASSLVLLGAFVVGGIWGVYMLATGKATAKTAVPFGPFLVLAAITMIWWPTLPRYFITYVIGWPY